MQLSTLDGYVSRHFRQNTGTNHQNVEETPDGCSPRDNLAVARGHFLRYRLPEVLSALGLLEPF